MNLKQKQLLESYIAKRVKELMKNKKVVSENKKTTDKKSLLTNLISKEVKKMLKEHAMFGGVAGLKSVGNIGIERAFNQMSDEEFDRVDEQEEEISVDDVDDDFNIIPKKSKRKLKEQDEIVEEKSDVILDKFFLAFKRDNKDLSANELSKIKDGTKALLNLAKSNYADFYSLFYRKLIKNVAAS